MIVACPGCNARYRIESDRLRPEGVRLRCSRCEAVFRVTPPPVATETAAAASPSALAPPIPMPQSEAPGEPAPSLQQPEVSGEPAPSLPQPEAPGEPAPSLPQPEAPGEPAPSLPQPEAPGEPAPSLPPPMSRPAAPDPAPPSVDRERMVLIADPVVEQGKSTASTLAQWGLQPALVHDGVEAILAIQRLLPRAIVIDAALPKMFGFQICEIVKRNESLRDIHVVLVGAIHDRTRYRRPPEEIYGADAYIERQDLPESLQSILQEFGMLSSDRQSTEVSAAATISSAPPVAAPDPTVAPAIPSAPPVVAPDPTVAPAIPSAPPVVAPDPAVAPAIPSAPPVVAPDPTVAPAAPFAPPVVASDPTVAPATPSAPPLVAPAPPVAPVVEETPEAEAPAAPKIVEPAGSTEPPVTHQTPESVSPPTPTSGDPETDEKVEQAERLARIVVSDIVLYSKEKFEAAVEGGNVLEAMQPEIAEGRSLFAARVDASIQEMRDFLTEELLRVAEARGKP